MAHRMDIVKGAAAVLFLLAAAGLIFQGCGGGGESERRAAPRLPLTILYSSDMLGMFRSCGCTVEDTGGLGRRASYIAEVRRVSKQVLVLDAGDAFSLDLSFTKKEAELTMDSFDLMGLDVFTPGEIDFVFGLPFLEAVTENAGFDVLAANVVDPSTGQPVFGKRYTVKTFGKGMRVAITGVLDEKISVPAYVDRSAFTVEPAEATLRKVIPLMKGDADYLILLSHMGLERTRKLLSKVKDFDIAVVGHGSPLLKENERSGRTLLLATGGLGQYIGRVEVQLSSRNGMEYGKTRLVTLSDDIPIHPGIKGIFRTFGVPLTDKEAGTH